jgi:hypothetical protein
MNGVANGVYGGDLPNQINTPWIDFSEQSTIVGWSSYTRKFFKYKMVGNIVYVYMNISGTSNSTSLNFSLPFIIKGVFGHTYSYLADNGAFQFGFLAPVTAPTNILNAYRFTAFNTATLTFTASGIKEISCQFFYEI